MKTNHIRILLFFALIVALAGCQQMNVEHEVAKTGIVLIDKVNQTYDKIDSLSYVDKDLRDMVSVLSNPAPDSMELPDKKRLDFSEQFQVRRQAFALLEQIFVILEETSQQGGRKISRDERKALIDVYSGIADFAELPQSVREKLPDTSKVEGVNQALEIRKHLIIIAQLTNGFFLLWHDDMPVWKEAVDEMYHEYYAFIQYAPVSVFDPEKVEKLLDEKKPYSNKNALINLYRLEKRKKIEKQRKQIKQYIDQLDHLFEKFNACALAISQKKYNQTEVLNTINEINTQLKDL